MTEPISPDQIFISNLTELVLGNLKEFVRGLNMKLYQICPEEN